MVSLACAVVIGSFMYQLDLAAVLSYSSKHQPGVVDVVNMYCQQSSTSALLI